jgi:hypothetical protein
MRKVLLAVWAASTACAQCTLWNQANCASYNPATSPTLAAFLSNALTNFQAIDASVANAPQPKMTLTAQNWACSGAEIYQDVALYGPYCQTYAADLAAYAGVTTQDVNIWQYAMASSPEYQALGISVPYELVTDCAGGGTLAKGGTPGGTAAANPRCWALYYYDHLFSYMAANNIVLRAGDPQNTDELTGCGFSGFPLGAGRSIMTEATYEDCLIPLHQAMIQRWGCQGSQVYGCVTAFQVMEEPTGGMTRIIDFTPAEVATFIQDDSGALKAVSLALPSPPSATLQIGAAGTGLSWPQKFDNAFWADWTNTSSPTYAALDFFGIDLFSGDCDLGTSNAQFPGQPYYPGELAGWVGAFSASPLCTLNCGSTALANQYGYITQAKSTWGTKYKPIRIEQSDAPMWCPLSGIAQQPLDILGPTDWIWDSSGFFNRWVQTIMHWASAQGIQSWSLFGSLPLFYYTTNPLYDNPEVGGSIVAIVNLLPNDSAAAYSSTGAWFAESLQGNARMTGNAQLGR